ncbi:hypothetical protein FRC11_010144, partial [Ceratobasidium sp. 423]
SWYSDISAATFLMPPITMYISDSDEEEPTSHSMQSIGMLKEPISKAEYALLANCKGLANFLSAGKKQKVASEAKVAPKAKASAQKQPPKLKNS